MKFARTLTWFETTKHESVVPVEIERIGKVWHLSYQILKNFDHVEWPKISSKPGRVEGLWKATCFEFFLGFRSQASYAEWNFSPSGDWCVFHFDDVRKSSDHLKINDQDFVSLRATDQGQVHVLIKGSSDARIRKILEASLEDLELQVAMVYQLKGSSTLNYASLKHLKSRPDFHDRRAFEPLVSR